MEMHELELFPNSESAKRMVARISPIYGHSYVGKWIFEVMGLEIDEVREIVASLRDQCFLERVTWGMRYWEERYGIEVDETLDLEYRRSRIQRAGTRYGPISPAKVEEIIHEFSGRIVHIVEDNPHYAFDLLFEEGEKDIDYTAIIEKVNSIKPSHLTYRVVLPRSQIQSLYFAAAVHQRKVISDVVRDSSGLGDIGWLADENGDTLLDEDGNVLIDAE